MTIYFFDAPIFWRTLDLTSRDYPEVIATGGAHPSPPDDLHSATQRRRITTPVSVCRQSK
jgi:hypothetical protein